MLNPQASERLQRLAYSLSGGRISGGGGGSAYNTIDPERMGLLAPDFLAASPASSPPGHAGPYDKLPGSASRSPGVHLGG